jgi:hypothetical protein
VNYLQSLRQVLDENQSRAAEAWQSYYQSLRESLEPDGSEGAIRDCVPVLLADAAGCLDQGTNARTTGFGRVAAHAAQGE